MDPADNVSLAISLLTWLATFGAFLAIGIVVALVAAIASNGAAGFRLVGRGIVGGIGDVFGLSLKRVWAISQLTIREAVRHKSLMVFVVFAVLFMFAGWFLSNSNSRADLQVQVYVSFVLTAIGWLILPVVLLISCRGLPEEIRSRSLHTVVTKPIRRSEIVVGKIVGFSVVGSVVLLLMGSIGYVWIQRQIPAEARDKLICRVPVYGPLQFLDRQGKPARQGINVGYYRDPRGYIEGATKGRAIWQFDGIRPSRTGETLLLESSFQAFRLHKGNMKRTLLGELMLVNEEKKLRVPLGAFEVNEFATNVTPVKREISFYDEAQKKQRTVDLYDDLAPDGKLRVEARCIDAGQFLGMAHKDLFIRAAVRPFFSGYAKAIVGIWLMLVLVVVFGVTASCFLKGPVATLLVLTLVVVGSGFHGFLGRLIQGDVKSGAVESMVNLATHRGGHHHGPAEADHETTGMRIVHAVDAPLTGTLWIAYFVVPNFNVFSMSKYVANGFDVPWNTALFPSILMVLAFLLPCLLLGYYSLKYRELESK